ncbi:type II toxin-antitoxin system HicB family antitoxin [Ancylobacter mangrovi]|uniref:type II toxin-antitoxin system HicB family antitoxin n=1 Tax=Ancylobacter mangrovi TaxID=2972472 RepID=UPI002161B2E1|nr:type II toxin-antitoxin system HicB family antitoxin [Ancylobacter mangrovi]MCS0501396.1 type II toxin-antitoxin system HicB family antitoxin [Ancylobacter mangrovi]
MPRALALIHEEAGTFGISFPDFPGCISTGATLDEAVRKGEQALALHIEGMTEDGEAMPRLRGFDEVRRDDPDALSGAVAVLVPAELPARAVRINITVDENLLARIDTAAKAAGQNRSAYLAEAAKARMMG